MRAEEIQNIYLPNSKPEIDKAYFEDAVQFVLNKIDRNLDKFAGKFPKGYSENHEYAVVDNEDLQWEPSFWTGMLWLAYELTRMEKYLRAAEKHLDSYWKRLENKMKVDHDLGFVYTLSAVAAYKITGNRLARDLALQAADKLAIRFREKGNYLVAWGDLSETDAPNKNAMIIDTLMNLSLLMWATEETGNRRYADLAEKHMHTALENLVREDGGTYHVTVFDYHSGDVLYRHTFDTRGDERCWSRGITWAMYGLPIMYSYTRDEKMLEYAKAVSNFYLNRLPEDLVSYYEIVMKVDEKDSSSAAISVCGLLEAAKHLPIMDENRVLYENAALHILKSLTENYTTKGLDNADGLLLHGMAAKGRYGDDECLIYGDYFYLEALVRVMKDWKKYW